VIELDDRLKTLRAQARGWGADLREMALDVDRDPEAIRSYLDREVLRYLATCRRFAEPVEPLLATDGRSVLAQVVLMEELACGDLGALLAAPGAPMAGPLVELLGDEALLRDRVVRLADARQQHQVHVVQPVGGQ